MRCRAGCGYSARPDLWGPGRVTTCAYPTLVRYSSLSTMGDTRKFCVHVGAPSIAQDPVVLASSHTEDSSNRYRFVTETAPLLQCFRGARSDVLGMNRTDVSTPRRSGPGLLMFIPLWPKNGELDNEYPGERDSGAKP